MRAVLGLTFLMLAACGAVEAPQPEKKAAEAPAPLQGEFFATSNTAMAITGDLTATHWRLKFANGIAFATDALGAIDVAKPMGVGEGSFREALPASASAVVELRRVTTDLTPRDVAIQAPCGPETPTFVALAYEAPIKTVTMAVFSGPDQPGPDAVKSALCGTFRYDRLALEE